MKRQSLLKGTLVLGMAGILAKFMGIFFRWPLQMLIGDEGVGYYQMSYPLYMFFVAVASGVPVAISKMVSERNAVNDKEGVIQILRKAVLLMVILGGGFSAFLLLFSKQIIALLKWDVKSYYSMMGIALAPIFIAVMSAFRGFFQGMQNMNYTAASQLVEQMGRVCIGIGLAFLLLPRGIEFSAGGAAFGAVAGGLLGGTYLIAQYYRAKKEFYIHSIKENKAILTKLIYTAVPVSLGATVGTIMGLIDSFLVPQKLLQAGFTSNQATVLYARLTGKASILINVPLTLSMALCASLVPIIAESYVLNRRRDVVSKMQGAIRLSFSIGLPSMLGLYFMAEPILKLIFPGHSEGHTILRYLAITVPFIILAQITTAILQGIGRYIRPVINLSIGCAFKTVITLLLVPIPGINVFGAVIGSIVGYVIAAVLNLILLKKTLNISINYYDAVIKPAYASVIMIIGVIYSYQYVFNHTKSNGISCIASIIMGIIVYGVLSLLFGIFKFSYIKKKLLKR